MCRVVRAIGVAQAAIKNEIYLLCASHKHIMINTIISFIMATRSRSYAYKHQFGHKAFQFLFSRNIRIMDAARSNAGSPFQSCRNDSPRQMVIRKSAERIIHIEWQQVKRLNIINLSSVFLCCLLIILMLTSYLSFVQLKFSIILFWYIRK